MKLKVFTQPNCPKCPAAKKLARKIEKENQVEIQWFDTSQVDGLAEAAFYQVMATPSLILLDERGSVVAEWRGETPGFKEVVSKIQS